MTDTLQSVIDEMRDSEDSRVSDWRDRLQALAESGREAEPFAYYDCFNDEITRSKEQAERAIAGGNLIRPLYFHPPAADVVDTLRGSPPEPVSHPSESWCDAYADWYYNRTVTQEGS